MRYLVFKDQLSYWLVANLSEMKRFGIEVTYKRTTNLLRLKIDSDIINTLKCSMAAKL